jgi:hypothetical protein
VLQNCITRGCAVGAQLICYQQLRREALLLSGRALRFSPAAIMPSSMAASSNRNKEFAQNLDKLHDSFGK